MRPGCGLRVRIVAQKPESLKARAKPGGYRGVWRALSPNSSRCTYNRVPSNGVPIVKVQVIVLSPSFQRCSLGRK